MSIEEHRARSASLVVKAGVITVSDTRSEDTDHSGRHILDQLQVAACQVETYRIVPDDPDEIVLTLNEAAKTCDVVLMNGGTGISRRDSTFEAVSSRLEKTLPGFGEIFRALSFEEIGPAAMLSRAVAGVYRETLVFSMPGSTAAVRLAMNRLIMPELRHLVWEILRQPL